MVKLQTEARTGNLREEGEKEVKRKGTNGSRRICLGTTGRLWKLDVNSVFTSLAESEFWPLWLSSLFMYYMSLFLVCCLPSSQSCTCGFADLDPWIRRRVCQLAVAESWNRFQGCPHLDYDGEQRFWK